MRTSLEIIAFHMRDMQQTQEAILIEARLTNGRINELEIQQRVNTALVMERKAVQDQQLRNVNLRIALVALLITAVNVVTAVSATLWLK